MIKKLGTQSIDIDLLSHNGSVIDIGCGYNFGLTKELLDIGCKVIGVDPNTRITDILKHPNFKFHQQAVVTNDSIKEIELLHYGLGTEAATVVQSQYKGFPFDPIDEICRVPTITIKEIMRRYKLDQVDFYPKFSFVSGVSLVHFIHFSTIFNIKSFTLYSCYAHVWEANLKIGFIYFHVSWIVYLPDF